MSAGWQVGDLALCVDATLRPYSYEAHKLEQGRVYTVFGVVIGPCTGRAALMISASNYPCTADRFRKIRPDEREACEPEFSKLLLRSKPKVDA